MASRISASRSWPRFGSPGSITTSTSPTVTGSPLSRNAALPTSRNETCSAARTAAAITTTGSPDGTDPATPLTRSLSRLAVSAELGTEDKVHDLGAGADDRAELAAVDRFGHAGRAMTDETGDLLGAHAAAAHQRDKGCPELARRPVVSYAGLPADVFEHPAHVARIQRRS